MIRLFEHSQGFIVAFGFDVQGRVPAPKMIAWCDPSTRDWKASPSNLAGYYTLAFDVSPEFVRECNGKIIVYQPGRCIEMEFVGAPYVWSVRTLQADTDVENIPVAGGYHR